MNLWGISWWLNRCAHDLHVSPNLLKLLVLAANLFLLLWFLHKVLFRGKEFSIPRSIRQRGQDIRHGLQRAESEWEGAKARLAEIEGRIAGQAGEIDAIRARAAEEAEAEYQRVLREAEAQLGRVRHLAAAEIDAATKQARQELKALAAKLVLELGERHLRESMTAELDGEVVRTSLAALAKKN